MFISIKVKEHFADVYSNECFINSLSVNMLLNIEDMYIIETDTGRFQIDKQSYEDLKKVLYGISPSKNN